MSNNEIKLSRKQAAQLLEEIREALYQAGQEDQLLEISALLHDSGIRPLTPCPGQAHTPEVAGMQDNCSICAPRWGWCGDKIKIT